MIRPIKGSDDGRPLYALTGRGVLVVSMLLALALTGAVLSVAAIVGTIHVQHTTCRVQFRGLAAQQHLTGIMHDLAVFVEPQRRQVPVPAPYRGALANLRRELPAYTRIEDAQPKHREC